MDAFFAAVEQRDHPRYRGRPVIVGADPKGGRGRGVVAACSYEARPFGIHSAMPIGRAYRLCPRAVFLPVRMERYQEVSERLFGIFARYTDLVEALSIDEAFLDVTGSTRLFGAAEAIARRIKADIRQEELVASVGVAGSKFVAKVASDLGKPDGFVAVPPGQEKAFLAPLPVSRLWGVGAKTERLLRSLGLITIGAVASWPEAALAARFGEAGRHLWALANGLDDRPVTPEEAAKSIGAETTFAEDTADPRLLRTTLLALAERVGRRLRREGVRGSTVTLKVRFEPFETHTRAQTLATPTALADDIFPVAAALLAAARVPGRRIRLLGIAVSRLVPAEAAGRQLPLFGEGGARRERVAAVMDAVAARFGEGALTRAALLPRPRRRRAGHGDA
ncbi:MAG: DNA polymerase IV [candidate division NC10 bacterium]|nr:DNA polymerase IV [candidate division NC10 bacterium]